MDTADRLAHVRERIDAAARRAGRDPAGVRLVAVGKQFPVERLRDIVRAGHRRLGENRVQEAESKAADLAAAVEWHLIGHLQGNKARRAARIFDWVHTVDSLAVARRLAAGAREAGRSINLLVQVDLAGTRERSGVPPEDLCALLSDLAREVALPLRGLMTLPPRTPTAEGARPHFRHLAALARSAADEGLLPPHPDLSMGMSADYEIAVEEGATLVRVGSGIFGARPAPPVNG
ncbi:MAG: YggS family pyridoxal phosphate-dependent enzyme [Acidobacteriota bacterium]